MLPLMKGTILVYTTGIVHMGPENQHLEQQEHLPDFTCGFHDQCTFWNPKPLEWQMIAAMTTDIWHQMVLHHFKLLKLPGDIGA